MTQGHLEVQSKCRWRAGITRNRVLGLPDMISSTRVEITCSSTFPGRSYLPLTYPTRILIASGFSLDIFFWYILRAAHEAETLQTGWRLATPSRCHTNSPTDSPMSPFLRLENSPQSDTDDKECIVRRISCFLLCPDRPRIENDQEVSLIVQWRWLLLS